MDGPDNIVVGKESIEALERLPLGKRSEGVRLVDGILGVFGSLFWDFFFAFAIMMGEDEGTAVC